MYRLQVQNSAGEVIGYQNVNDLTDSEFIDIATGARPVTKPQGDWPPAGTVYCAVWDDVECQWLADISAEAAQQHQSHCWSAMYP